MKMYAIINSKHTFSFFKIKFEINSLILNSEKANGKKRPLGISTYEDKLVQYGLKCVLEAVFEPRFIDNMYGFRPNRNCHDAIKSLGRIIERGKISYVLDADIKGFFNNIDHDWLIKFVGVHISDPNIMRLLKKILKAGISENGELQETKMGVEQGSLCGYRHNPPYAELVIMPSN